MLETLHIEPSGVPIYIQLRDQVLRAIGAGLIKPGERMPTMRQVAVALRIDLNTVKHAYDALASTGAIEVQPARGSFVAQLPLPVDVAQGAARIDPIEVAKRILAIIQKEGRHT